MGAIVHYCPSLHMEHLTDLSNNKRKNDEYTNKGGSANHSVHGALKKSLFRVDSLVALIHHNPTDQKSLILVKDIPREIKNTRKDQQLRLRLQGHLNYLDNCSCCITGTEYCFLGNGHNFGQKRWHMIAIDFEIHRHMSQSNCSTLPRVNNDLE